MESRKEEMLETDGEEKKVNTGAGGAAELLEYSPSMRKALRSISSTE